MKRLIYLLLAICAIGFMSCSKEEEVEKDTAIGSLKYRLRPASDPIVYYTEANQEFKIMGGPTFNHPGAVFTFIGNKQNDMIIFKGGGTHYESIYEEAAVPFENGYFENDDFVLQRDDDYYSNDYFKIKIKNTKYDKVYVLFYKEGYYTWIELRKTE